MKPYWRRTDRHCLSGLSRMSENNAQGKKTLVEIMGLRVKIAWNLEGWCEIAFWATVVTLPQGTLESGKFLLLGLKICDFDVYSNFDFLNNFLLKSQNKVPLVLERPLRSAVYDFAFNSIFQFLLNFVILSPNHVISAN